MCRLSAVCPLYTTYQYKMCAIGEIACPQTYFIDDAAALPAFSVYEEVKTPNIACFKGSPLLIRHYD